MTISSMPCGAGRLDEQIEHRDHALGPLEREALRADVVLVDELLEDLGVGELREDAQRARSRRGCTRFRVDSMRVLQPVAHLGLFDVRELDADGRAVGLREVRDDLAERRALRQAAHPDVGEDGSRSASLRPKFSSSSSGVEGPSPGGLRGLAERIEVGEEVAADAVRVDELEDPPLDPRGLEHRLGRRESSRAEVGLRESARGKGIRRRPRRAERGRAVSLRRRAREGERRGDRGAVAVRGVRHPRSVRRTDRSQRWGRAAVSGGVLFKEFPPVGGYRLGRLEPE